jgi:hypothetical protein
VTFRSNVIFKANPKPQDGAPLLVGSPGLLISYNRNYLEVVWNRLVQLRIGSGRVFL